MKAGTTELLKFKKLCMRLNLRKWEAVGVLESLWMVTAKNAYQGDIGKFSNDDIAVSIEWPGDPDQLVTALVDCGWIDEDEDFRLIIHDWSDHCPTYIKGNLAKHGKMFADQAARQAAKQAPKEVAKHVAKQGAVSNVLPSLAYSSQFNPPPPTPSVGEGEKTAEEEAVELLISCGVQFAVQAVRPAFANGATLQDIERICGFFLSRPGAYKPNALQRKVTNFSRAEPLDMGWPEPNAKWIRDQEIQQRASQRVQQAELQDEIKARDKAAKQDRERRHGPRFRSLSDQQVRQLITEIFAGQFVLGQHQDAIRKHGMDHYRNSSVYRDQVYQRLDQISSTEVA